MAFGWFGDTAMSPFNLFWGFVFVSGKYTNLQPNVLLPPLTLK